MLNAITELEPRFRRSGQQQMLVETMLVRFALMDRTVSLEEVLRGMGGDGGGRRGERWAWRVAPSAARTGTGSGPIARAAGKRAGRDEHCDCAGSSKCTRTCGLCARVHPPHPSRPRSPRRARRSPSTRCASAGRACSRGFARMGA